MQANNSLKRVTWFNFKLSRRLNLPAAIGTAWNQTTQSRPTHPDGPKEKTSSSMGTISITRRADSLLTPQVRAQSFNSLKKARESCSTPNSWTNLHSTQVARQIHQKLRLHTGRNEDIREGRLGSARLACVYRRNGPIYTKSRDVNSPMPKSRGSQIVLTTLSLTWSLAWRILTLLTLCVYTSNP